MKIKQYDYMYSYTLANFSFILKSHCHENNSKSPTKHEVIMPLNIAHTLA